MQTYIFLISFALHAFYVKIKRKCHENLINTMQNEIHVVIYSIQGSFIQYTKPENILYKSLWRVTLIIRL